MNPPYTPKTPDEQEIADLYKQLLTCWNERNAAGFARLIGDRGNVVGFDGSQLDGRAAVEASLHEIFSKHQTASYISKIREILKLTDNIFLLRSVAGMIPPGKSDINPAVNAIQSVVAVRHKGTWEIALYQNTPAQFHGRPEVAEALTNELKEELMMRTV